MHAAWQQLQSHYKGKHGILIASAECVTKSGSGSGKSLCDHYKVSGYPFILSGDCSHKKSRYKYGRDYKTLLAFAQKLEKKKGADEIIDTVNSTDPSEVQPTCPDTAGALNSVLV